MSLLLLSFFFNATATTEIYTLSLHDALPILFVQNGPDTVVVAAVTAYDFYFGSNASGPGVVPFGRDTMRLGIPWDTLTVQDPFQSWFVFSTAKNGGEVWGTREAARLSTANPKWVRLIDGIGGDRKSVV